MLSDSYRMALGSLMEAAAAVCRAVDAVSRIEFNPLGLTVPPVLQAKQHAATLLRETSDMLARAVVETAEDAAEADGAA